MQKLKILPTTLYKYTLPDEVYNQICEQISTIDFTDIPNRNERPEHGKSSSGKKSLHRKANWKFLTDYVNPELHNIATDVGYINFESIKISLMWANVSLSNQWHHTHKHPWSILSGIIYVQGNSGKTWFSRTNDYALENRMFNGLFQAPENQIIHKHSPEDKTMLIFPSMLAHSVSENLSSLPRITISFNSYFDGVVGDPCDLTGLELKLL